MINLSSIAPAFIFLLAAFIVPFLKGNFRNIFVIFVPLITFFHILNLDTLSSLTVPFLDFQLTLIRADEWSKVFGYVFTLSAFATSIYGFYQKKSTEFFSAFLYIGSALGVVFSGDLISLYIFWELMALTSVILILANRTQSSRHAALRYVIVHVFGGLVLLAGIVLQIFDTGSISFSQFTVQTPATWLILIGFLVNAAAYPLSAWLPDAYPKASIIGGVILSAYTSKTAVYTLIRGFAGWDILITIGCIMAVYGIIYAFIENDIRRILAFAIVNQVGFMVCAVGIGTPLALAGASAHAFGHIIYKALLWMAAGAILYRTGKTKLTDLGGLYKHMPITFIMFMVAALATAAPFTSGYTTKPILFAALQQAGAFWPWLILEVTSAAVFLCLALKIPYFAFFGKSNIQTPVKDANKMMILGMSFLASICILLGLFPSILYNALPEAQLVISKMGVSLYDLYVYKFYKVIVKFQIMVFTALFFFIFIKRFVPSDRITLDTDWLYRKAWPLFYDLVKRSTTAINNAMYFIFIEQVTEGLIKFFRNAPVNVLISLLKPFWLVFGVQASTQSQISADLKKSVESNTFPVGLVALFILIMVGLFSI